MDQSPSMLRRSWKSWSSMELTPAGPRWLEWVWSVLFAVAVGFGFTVVGMLINSSADRASLLDGSLWWFLFRINFVIALTVSVTIHLLFMVTVAALGVARIRCVSSGWRAAFFIAVPTAGVLIGWPLGVWLAGLLVSGMVHIGNPAEIISSAVLALLISSALVLLFNARARQAQAEKRAAEAQLRLLQGQMEPHFLFNTLANVQTLIEHDPAQASRMLESFTAYLRASLGSLRRDSSSLGAELELSRAYLDLFQSRMADRLRYQIECDSSLNQQPLQPLLLQPLVENAIQHGLEPQVDGGSVLISARRDGNRLLLTVQDDGPGIDAAPLATRRAGNGMALNNLRERLRTAHGDNATLTLTDTAPGTLATLNLPIEEQTE